MPSLLRLEVCLTLCLLLRFSHPRVVIHSLFHHSFTTHLIQRPCCQRGNPCQDPVGNRTTRRPPDHRKEMQTALVWTCLLLISKAILQGTVVGWQAEEEVGRQHDGMNRPGVRQVPEGSGEQGKMEKTGCKIVCGAPTTLAVKG